eukprot:3104204-Rhodomonas_salina.1
MRDGSAARVAGVQECTVSTACVVVASKQCTVSTPRVALLWRWFASACVSSHVVAGQRQPPTSLPPRCPHAHAHRPICAGHGPAHGSQDAIIPCLLYTSPSPRDRG